MNKTFDSLEISGKQINSGKNRDIQLLGKGQKQRVIQNCVKNLCFLLKFPDKEKFERKELEISKICLKNTSLIQKYAAVSSLY